MITQTEKRQVYKASYIYSAVLKDGEMIEYEHFLKDGKDMINVNCNGEWIESEVAPFYCPEYMKKTVYDLEAHRVYYNHMVVDKMGGITNDSFLNA